MEMTMEHVELIEAAKGRYGGHIKKVGSVDCLSDGFQDSAEGLILWFDDSDGSTHITSHRDLCPECKSYKCNCNNINN